LNLLLDVHHSRLAAERLRGAGHDVVAASDDPWLSGLSDEDLLRRATADGRALVTENVKDFDRIVRSWVTTGEQHAGVVVTSPWRFHRGRASYPEDMVVALGQWLAEQRGEQGDWVHWLE
jgi:hypothetical protein